MITATVYTVNVPAGGIGGYAYQPRGTSSQTPTPSMHSDTTAKNVTHMPPGTPVSWAS